MPRPRHHRHLLVLSVAVLLACGVDQGPGESSAALNGGGGIVPGVHVHKMPKKEPGSASNRNALTAQATSANLVYYGGRVISNVQVVQVLYGSGTYLSELQSTGTPSMASFYGGITNSPYFDWLSEYNTAGGTNQTIGRGTFLKQVQITPSAANSGTTIDDYNIEAELAAQIQAGTLPAPTTDAAGNPNTVYMVNFPEGVTITQGGSTSCVAGGFCAYHGTFGLNGQDVYYGVLPDMSPGSGCDVGCGTGASQFDNQTSVASHELVESVTDGEIGFASVVGPPLAWYDSVNGEIGDICNQQQGTLVGGDGVTYVVQKEWSNTDNACIVQHATPTSDFSISASPASVSLPQNQSSTVSVSTAVTAGSAQGVSLSISGLPAGATGSFSSSTITAGSSSILTVQTGTAAPGTYVLTVTGTGTSTTHTTALTLTVQANDFSITASPSSVSLAQNQSSAVTVSTLVTVGSPQSVSLSISGLPAGATGSFSSSTMAAGSSSTLTIQAGTAAPGTYALSVTGTGTSATHSAALTLTVQANDFSITASPASMSLAAAASGSVTISTAVTSGNTQTVGLTISGVPAGATASFNPTSVTAGSSSTLTINAGTAAAGTYSLTVTGTGSSTHVASISLTVTSSGGGTSNAVVNGGFETGTLTGWTASGVTSIVSGAHSGSYAAQVGSTGPTSSSSIAQTIVVPAGATKLTFWYKVSCPDTVRHDWATATLMDNNTGRSTTVLSKTCTNTGAWQSVSASVTAGHSVTLTLSNHDDDKPSDPTYTQYDDVNVQ